MRNRILKTLLITVFICFTTLISRAQLGNNFSQLDIGAAGVSNSVYGDAESVTTTISGTLSLNYNQTPYLNYILEAQGGKFEGGDAKTDRSGRQFSNSFAAFDFRVQGQLGEVIDYHDSQFANAMKNLYLSGGIGYIVNHIKTNRYSEKIPDFYTPGLDNSNEIFIPLRIGYEFKIYNSVGEPSVKIDLGYQYNLVMGDELDGFKAGKNNDSFRQISLGVKFAIGGTASYRKPIGFF